MWICLLRFHALNAQPYKLSTHAIWGIEKTYITYLSSRNVRGWATISPQLSILYKCDSEFVCFFTLLLPNYRTDYHVTLLTHMCSGYGKEHRVRFVSKEWAVRKLRTKTSTILNVKVNLFICLFVTLSPLHYLTDHRETLHSFYPEFMEEHRVPFIP